MTSATEPLRKASTGVAHAIASIMTRPNGSGRRSGTARRARLAEEFALGGLVDLTDEFNAGPVEQRLDPYAEILLVGLVDLGRNLEWDDEKLTRGRVVPIISASVSWLVLAAAILGVRIDDLFVEAGPLRRA
jgi:hypothetical protein